MDIWQRLLLLKKNSEESVTEIRFLYLKIRHPAKPLSKNQIQLLLQSSFCFHLPVWPHLKRHGEYSKQKCRKETLTLIWQVFNFQHTPFLEFCSQCWDAEVTCCLAVSYTWLSHSTALAGPWREKQDCALLPPSSFTEAGALLSSISSRLFG